MTRTDIKKIGLWLHSACHHKGLFGCRAGSSKQREDSEDNWLGGCGKTGARENSRRKTGKGRAASWWGSWEEFRYTEKALAGISVNHLRDTLHALPGFWAFLLLPFFFVYLDVTKLKKKKEKNVEIHD